MVEKKRKLCNYPMNKFYTYKDEIPAGVRVSTADDCTKCEQGIFDTCDVNYCLITVDLNGENVYPIKEKEIT